MIYLIIFFRRTDALEKISCPIIGYTVREITVMACYGDFQDITCQPRNIRILFLILRMGCIFHSECTLIGMNDGSLLPDTMQQIILERLSCFAHVMELSSGQCYLAKTRWIRESTGKRSGTVQMILQSLPPKTIRALICASILFTHNPLRISLVPIPTNTPI